MFEDLNNPELQPAKINPRSIKEINISEQLRTRLYQMFMQEEKQYCKVWGTTSLVQTDKAYVFFANQWLYLAVLCKKYAQALYKYCEFFDQKMRPDADVMNCIKSQNYSGSSYTGLFDTAEDREYMKRFISGDTDFRPGKNLVNSGEKIRSCKDVFGSCVLAKLNVPNASSAYLGNLIYYLSKRPTLYDELEKEINGQMTSGEQELQLPGGVKDCAKAIVDYIYKLDGFNSIKERFEINEQFIKINTNNANGLLLDGNWLRYMFARPSSVMYNNDAREGKPRVFDDEYQINIGGVEYKCKLTTEWVGSDIKEDAQGNNYLQALIKLVGYYYSDSLEIEEKDGGYFLRILKQKFLKSDLPEALQSEFAGRYITSLLAKPFVILTGNSGTGKTRVAKQLSEYLERTIDGRKNWLIVPVGADWTDNTKLLGFFNPLEGKYVSTPVLDFILDACKNPDVPYFLILDEMNLSHVERYFSDFLSAMESDEEIPLYKSPEGKDNGEKPNEEIPENIKLPGNLFVTGTVNIDETTYMFSPKVLDRANVVEFRPEMDDVLSLMTGAGNTDNVCQADFGIAEGFLDLAHEIRSGVCNVEPNGLELVREFLEGIYESLQECGFEFAFRTVKEMRLYLSAAYELQKKDFNLARAMDEQIVQKVLPKIYGDRKQVGELLDALEGKCQMGIGDPAEEMTLSLMKIGQMKKRLDKYQYTSFM